MHRDISEGNVMIANGRGFLHDLDYGFNWKAFLRELGYEDTEASWNLFVETEQGIPRAGDGQSVAPCASGSAPGSSTNIPPHPSASGQVNEVALVDTIIAERGAGDDKMYLVRRRGTATIHDEWQARSRVEGSVMLTDWLNRPRLERKQLSTLYSSAGSSLRTAEPLQAAVDAGTDVASPSGKAKMVMECKQRTVSICGLMPWRCI